MPWHSRWPNVTDITAYAQVLRQGEIVTTRAFKLRFGLLRLLGVRGLWANKKNSFPSVKQMN